MEIVGAAIVVLASLLAPMPKRLPVVVSVVVVVAGLGAKRLDD